MRSPLNLDDLPCQIARRILHRRPHKTYSEKCLKIPKGARFGNHLVQLKNVLKTAKAARFPEL